MPAPIALCIEDIDATGKRDRYVRCVALPGNRPGLTVDAAGQCLWQSAEGTGFELWVSADDKLILFRRTGAARLQVERAGRSLEVPAEKPVVLLDQDLIRLGSRRLRIHVHGVAQRIHAPSPWTERAPTGVSKLAVAMAIGASAVGCRPTETARPSTDASGTAQSTAAASSLLERNGAIDGAMGNEQDGQADSANLEESIDGGAAAAGSAAPDASSRPDAARVKPIEVRDHPPKPARVDPDDF